MASVSAGKDAGILPFAPRYVRHRPEETLLQQIVEQHYPAFLDHLAREGRTLPDYVEREFEAYLQCGRLEGGGLARALRGLP